MSDANDGLVCPECGGPIGQTATYCMHCSADLTEERDAADADDDGVWDGAELGAGSGEAGSTSGSATTAEMGGGAATQTGTDDELLDPDGLVDNTLTIVVGILGGIVVGIVGTIVLAIVTGSGLGVLFGFVTWLGSTAYLVRRRTVQGAVSKSGYAVAGVLLLIPFVAVSPAVSVDGGLVGRVETFFVLLVMVALPAGVAAGVGVLAAQFVPEGGSGSVE